MTDDVQKLQMAEVHKTEFGWTRSEIGMILIFLTALFFFRIYNLTSYDVLSADGTGYGPTGQAFFKTGDFKVFGSISGPVYPFFVGLLNLIVPDIESSLRMVSVFFSTMTVGVVYFMGRAFYNKPAAIAAALFCATLPFLHGMSGFDITEPTFTFFLLAGTFAFWKAYIEMNRLYAVVAGLLLVISYLTRSEGFITCFALSVFAVIELATRFRQSGKQLLLSVMIPFWLSFMLLFAPYLVYLHNMTGEWHLSGKAAGNAQVIKAYLGLTNDGIDVKFRFNKSGDGFDTAKGEGLGKLIRENPQVFLFNIKKNFSELPAALNGAMPWYLLFAAAAAFFVFPWNRKDLLARACIISICSPLIIYILFFVQQRGFHPYISALCVMAGAGVSLPGRFLEKSGIVVVLRPLTSILLLALPLAGYYVYLDFPREKPPYNYEQDGGRRDDKHIGLRLKKILPPDAIIMTRSGRIAFYAEKPMIIPPQEPYEKIMDYAQKNRVTHLILTIMLANMRPQLQPLFAPLENPGVPFTPPAGIKMIYAGIEPGGLPYIVYELGVKP